MPSAARPAAIRRRRLLGSPLLLFLSLGLLASLLVLYATPWGPWAFSDGTGYLVSARNFMAGIGLGLVQPSGEFQPLTSHPPLYPLTLSLLSFTGMDLVTAARWVDVLALGLLVFLSGWYFHRLTRSLWLAVILALWLLLSPALLETFTSVFAEPLFLLAAMVSSFLVVEYTLGGQRSLLLGAAALGALAPLSRYPAIAWVAACAACIALFGSRPHRVRLLGAGAFAVIALLPVGVSVLLTTSQPGAEPARAVQAAIDLSGQLRPLGRDLLSVFWFWRPTRIPGLELPRVPHILAYGALAAAFAAAFLAWARRRRLGAQSAPTELPAWRLATVFSLGAAAHVLFLSGVFLVSYPTPDINSRTMLPALPMLMVAVLAITAIYQRTWPSRRTVHASILCLAVAIAGGFGLGSRQHLQAMHASGAGYTGRAWRESETMKAAAALPAGVRLISNEPEAVLLYTNRYPHYMAEIYLHAQVDPALPFGADVGEEHRLFREEDAALVLFDSVRWQLVEIYGDHAGERLAQLTSGLHKAFEGSDGSIYFAAPPPR